MNVPDFRITYNTSIFVDCSPHGIDVHFPGLFIDWNVSNLHVEVSSCLLVIQFTRCTKKSAIVVVGKFLKEMLVCENLILKFTSTLSRGIGTNTCNCLTV